MTEDESLMWEQIYAGKPVDGFRIIDGHAHMGYYSYMYIPAPTPEDMLHSMDRLGIDLCCLSHHMALTSDNVRGNSLVGEVMRKYPGRFMGYASVNPNYPYQVEDELRRCFYDLGFRLIKLHPILHKYPLNGWVYEPVFEFADRCHAPVLIHTWVTDDPFGNPDLFEKTAIKYPGATFIMGHSGGPYGATRAIEIARKYPNVYLDLTLSITVMGLIERLVKEVGAERIIFGTDNPWLDPSMFIGRLGLSRVGFEEKKVIFSGNFQKLLDGVTLP